MLLKWSSPCQYPNQISLRFLRYGPNKIFFYDEAQLHPLTNVPTKYKLPTPYGFRDMARTRFFKVKVITARWKVRSRSNHGTLNYDLGQLHPLTKVPTKTSTSYTLQFSRYGPDKIFKVKVTTTRSKVKSRLNYDVAHLHPQPMSLPSINTLPLIVTEI